MRTGTPPAVEDTDMPDVSDHHSAVAFDLLPAEVLGQILSDPSIDRDDLKSCRLARRALVDPATELLFRRICISELWTDRNAFLAIANTPHLACVVRTVAWPEIPERSANLSIAAAHLPRGFLVGSDIEHAVDSTLPDPDDALYHDLVLQAKNLFWWPIVDRSVEARALPTYYPEVFGTHEEQLAAQNATRDEFLPIFVEALRKLPKLHRLVSEPRNPCHQLQSAHEGYPITGQVFNNFYINSPYAIPCNLAFHHFLLPAIQALAGDHEQSSRVLNRTTSPLITRLCLRDPGYKASDVFERVIPLSKPGPFRHLTHLELELGESWFWWFRNHKDARSLIEDASSLTHLRLCFQRRRQTISDEPKSEFLDTWPLLPRLQFLQVDSYLSASEPLVAFVKRHSQTLFRFQLDTPFPREGLEEDLRAAAPRLQIAIFVNGEEEEPFAEDEYDPWTGFYSLEPEGPKVIQAHSEGPPVHLPLVNHRWHSRWRREPKNSLDFDPFEDAGWELAGHCHTLTPDDFDTKENLRAEITEGDCVVPDEEDERPGYANEAVSFLRHRGQLYGSRGVPLQQTPRWFFARDPEGQFYYRQAHSKLEQDGFLTENWHFIHRNGEQAYGDEPLEIWSDWEGSEAGDFQEPTPFGWQLKTALKMWPRGKGWEEEMKRQEMLKSAGCAHGPLMKPYVLDEDPVGLTPPSSPVIEARSGPVVYDDDDDDDDDL